MHRREGHIRYMGSFLDRWVGTPDFVGHMKLIFFYFVLFTHVVLLLLFSATFGALGPILRLPDVTGTSDCADSLFKC